MGWMSLRMSSMRYWGSWYWMHYVLTANHRANGARYIIG